MASSERKHQIKVSYPDNYSIVDGPVAGQIRRRRRDANEPVLAEHESEFVTALASDQMDMELLDVFTLTPGPGEAPDATRRRRGGEKEPTSANVSIDVPVGADEFAVLLTEQDGVFSWRLPSAIKPTSRRRNAGADVETSQPRQFTFEFDETQAQPQGRVRRSSVVSWMLKPLRAFVIKFTARAAGKITMKFLERNVRPGPIHVPSAEVADWRQFNPSDWEAPDGQAASVLLLVHGTFSSTRGSFGGLADIDEGKAFLEKALVHYDLVMGYDHPTLSQTPEENAKDILLAFESITWPHPPEIDVVCFSRGGLVARYLIEQLLPESSLNGCVKDVVFVGCTNAGTHLAKPENWRVLVDTYTNLALLTCKAAEMFPTTKIPAAVISEALQGVSSFVKYLVSEAVTEGGVPGLAAMEPDGELIAELNQSAGNLDPLQTTYRVIQSNFDVSWFRNNGDNETLLSRVVLALANSLADQLMQRDNDMVVHTESMAEFGPRYSSWFTEANRVAFANDRNVHHLAYFVSNDVARHLRNWLIES